jgi:hypothetical protein
MHVSESSLLFSRFTRPPEKPTEKKGEKAKVLFLINAGLAIKADRTGKALSLRGA